jgi:WD40 repeat protein
MAVSGDGIKAATGESGGTSLLVWRFRDLAVVGQLRVPAKEGTALVCFSCGDIIGPYLLAVCADAERTVAVYDWQKYGAKAAYPGTPLATRAGGSRTILSVACMPRESEEDSDVWVTVGVRHLRFWRLVQKPTTGQKKSVTYSLEFTNGVWHKELGTETTLVSVACVGRVTIAGSQDGCLYLINNMAVTNVVRGAHALDKSGCASVLCTYTTVLQNQNFVTTGGRDGKFKMWEVTATNGAQACSKDDLKLVAEIDVHKTSKRATNVAGLQPSIVTAYASVVTGIRSLGVIERPPDKKGNASQKEQADSSKQFLVLAATSTNEVLLIDPDSDKSRLLVQGHFTPHTEYLAMHPTKSLFATAGADCSVRVWSAEQRCLLALSLLTEGVTCITWAPREQLDHHIAVGLQSGGIAVLVFRVNRTDMHVNTFPATAAPKETPPAITALAYSPSNRCSYSYMIYHACCGPMQALTNASFASLHDDLRIHARVRICALS